MESETGRTVHRQRPLHDWDVTPVEAVALQQRLRGMVSATNAISLEALRAVAGVDASYKDDSYAAVVVLTFPELEVIERAVARRRTSFPYVPGLLSFREVPVVIDALERLHTAPDLIMVDGQGIAHPRRFGLASHLGVYIGLPAIGCAKSRLTGTHEAPDPAIGDHTPLLDRGETIGAVLRSRAGTTPLYVSLGHKIDLDAALAVVIRCLRGYRMPEPTRLADRLAGQFRRGEVEGDALTSPVAQQDPSSGQLSPFDPT